MVGVCVRRNLDGPTLVANDQLSGRYGLKDSPAILGDCSRPPTAPPSGSRVRSSRLVIRGAH